jgi:3D (Asp-Asp-Asp) domain-containing protein
VAQQPEAEIVGYGTKIVPFTIETPDGVITVYRELKFWATSYSPKFVGGSTRTASGKTLQKGMVGVDVHYIPFGTLLYIPGYGLAEAADMGAISGRWIDLGYSDDDYVAWHQWVTVYFLWPPPGYVPSVIPPPSHY